MDNMMDFEENGEAIVMMEDVAAEEVISSGYSREGSRAEKKAIDIKLPPIVFLALSVGFSLLSLYISLFAVSGKLITDTESLEQCLKSFKDLNKCTMGIMIVSMQIASIIGSIETYLFSKYSDSFRFDIIKLTLIASSGILNRKAIFKLPIITTYLGEFKHFNNGLTAVAITIAAFVEAVSYLWYLTCIQRKYED